MGLSTDKISSSHTCAGRDALDVTEDAIISGFQSTHPRGVRRHRPDHTSSYSDFNPRTRVGCDPGPQLIPGLHYISIHAPAWGATRLWQCVCRWRVDFNPRTRVGCDGGKICLILSFTISIHAPAWGATVVSHLRLPRLIISIHAPAWGATQSSSVFQSYMGFQSTHPRGVRQWSPSRSRSSLRFQSTHPRGVRPFFVSHFG